jgi:phosphopantetheine--protein transferase-like protein
MIHGVGVDLVHLDRVRRFASDHQGRLPEMFSREERASPARMAEAFALKEAVLKALGGLSGWELNWREIGTRGQGPTREIRLYGKVKAHAQRLAVGELFASVAAARGAVMATVIAQAR